MASVNNTNNTRLTDVKLEMRRAQVLEREMRIAYQNAKKNAIDNPDDTNSEKQIKEAYFEYDKASRASSTAQSRALSEAYRVYGDLALAHADVDIFGIDNEE